MPQDPFLFSASIADNIALGRPDATRAGIAHACELAAIHDDIARALLTDAPLLPDGILLAGCLANVIRYVQLTRLAGVAMSSVKRLRKEVYGHVLRLPMAFFDKAITDQLVSRVTNDTEQVKNLYVQVLFVLLDGSIVVLGTMAAMVWLTWAAA